MKKFLVVILFFLLSFVLTSCAILGQTPGKKNSTNETWMQTLEANPDKWAYGADTWFFSGAPSPLELTLRHAPYSSAFTRAYVNVPDFTNLHIIGDFQVQLFGCDHNSVYIQGSNDAIKSISVRAQGNRIVIAQPKDSTETMKKIIVRIGIREINHLVYFGNGKVEGRQLFSNHFVLTATGCGDIYLAGNCFHVKKINNLGAGIINLFGISSDCLDINSTSHGSINISGNVRIRSISHRGSGNINIMGASGSAAIIYADGSGKIAINGNLDVRRIIARGATCVFICNARSKTLQITLSGNAIVGLMGVVGELNVEAFDNAKFLGQHLCAIDAYVKGHGCSHISVTATNKTFAYATNMATIYYFGQPNRISQVLSNNGVVIPVMIGCHSNCSMGCLQPKAR